jgi:hypothetical protein
VPELQRLRADHAPAVLAFVPIRPAGPAELSDQPGTWYRLDLPTG